MAEVLDGLARVLRQFATVLGASSDSTLVAVVGGLAVSVRTEPRFTRDVGVAVAVPDDAAAEALAVFLQRVGHWVFGAFEHENGRMSTIRLVPPGASADGVLVDILFACSGIEAEIVAAAEVLPGLQVPVARTGHLIAMKLLSVDGRRAKDAEDLVGLGGVCDPAELARAREAVDRITTLGYHRGRNLRAALARFEMDSFG